MLFHYMTYTLIPFVTPKALSGFTYCKKKRMLKKQVDEIGIQISQVECSLFIAKRSVVEGNIKLQEAQVKSLYHMMKYKEPKP